MLVSDSGRHVFVRPMGYYFSSCCSYVHLIFSPQSLVVLFGGVELIYSSDLVQIVHLKRVCGRDLGAGVLEDGGYYSLGPFFLCSNKFV